MTLDKERLRVLAEAATPGPWEWDDAVWEDYDPKERAPWLMAGGSLIDPVITGEVHCGEADAHYIAAANPKTVLALLSENAAKDKQLAAYATLVKSIEERQRLASDEHAKAIEARDSLQSERDANSILTTENAALAAEVERLRKSPLLAERHTGMRVDYSGLLGQCQRALRSREPANAEMLRQLKEHLQELGRRWYAGDTAVVDEILQLYCIERDARAAMAEKGGVHGPLIGCASPPTAQAEGWVSVEERLPPVRTTVFIASGAGPSAWRTLAFYDPDRYTPAWRCNDDPSEGIRGVSHWMHMPLPPTSAEGVEHG